jgi:hypothetical protein
VEQLTSTDEKRMNNRSIRNPVIKITYLGEQNEASVSKHLRSVGEKLLESLRLLVLNETDSVFGREAQYEIVGEELIFTILYPMHVIIPEAPQPLQENLEPNIDVK